MELMLSVCYTAKPGRREEFVRRIVQEGILTAVRAEEGCLGYDYYFSAERENEVLLLEKWESEPHQRAHMTQPHMAALRAIKEECIDRTEVKALQEGDYAL